MSPSCSWLSVGKSLVILSAVTSGAFGRSRSFGRHTNVYTPSNTDGADYSQSARALLRNEHYRRLNEQQQNINSYEEAKREHARQQVRVLVDSARLERSTARSRARKLRQSRSSRKLNTLSDATEYCRSQIGEGNAFTTVDPAKFAPQMTFHPDEKYFPSSIEFGLEKAQLCRDDDGTCVEGPVTPEMLQASSRDTYIQNTDPERLYGSIPGPDNTVSAPMYTYTMDGGDHVPYVDLQYWFYFPYNGCVKLKFGFKELFGGHKNYFGNWCNLGIHEGDWENVAVRVCKNNENVHSLRYAAHNKDHVRDCTQPGQCSFVEGTHPVAFSGLDSHATFFTAGVHDREHLPDALLYAAAPGVLSCGIFNTLRLTDLTSDAGAVWEAWKQPDGIVQISDKVALSNYAGRWGKTVQEKTVERVLDVYKPGKNLPCGISFFFKNGAGAIAGLTELLDKYMLNHGPRAPPHQRRWNLGVTA